jgi:hypothetical protein
VGIYFTKKARKKITCVIDCKTVHTVLTYTHLPFLIWKVPPHLTNNFTNVPQLAFRILVLDLFPNLCMISSLLNVDYIGCGCPIPLSLLSFSLIGEQSSQQAIAQLIGDLRYLRFYVFIQEDAKIQPFTDLNVKVALSPQLYLE